jgi:hypothetical protein
MAARRRNITGIGKHLIFAAFEADRRPIGEDQNILPRCSPFDASLDSCGNLPVRRTEQKRLAWNSLIGRHHTEAVKSHLTA